MNEIYIQLLDEGTTVFRLAQGIPMGKNIFKVLATNNYDRADEIWEFPPGSVVVRERKMGRMAKH